MVFCDGGHMGRMGFAALGFGCVLWGQVCLGSVSLVEAVRANPGQFSGLAEYRTFNGVGNNPHHPDWGSTGSVQLRIGGHDYADPRGVPSGGPNPRLISNVIHSDPFVGPRAPGDHFAPVTDMFWAWGQFLDHDITLTNVWKDGDAEVKDPIPVPPGDPHFDPEGYGDETIAFSRSKIVPGEGAMAPVNDTTAFVDASQVYGSDPERANALMDKDAGGRITGFLRFTPSPVGPLLPHNIQGLDNGTDGLRRIPKRTFFLAGDVRANEHVSLNSLHTLFLREHNRIVRVLRSQLRLPPEAAFEMARALVTAQMQVITYRDWLPLLVGEGAMGVYDGYRAKLNPGIRALFSTAAFRFGHSMVSPQISLSGPEGEQVALLPVRDTFRENVPPLMYEGKMPLVLHGLTRQRARRLDPFVTDELRNFLFGLPAPLALLRRPLGIPKGLDLVSLNIHRGRDHGVIRYNAARVAYGLPPVRAFDGINPGMGEQFRSVYGTVPAPGPAGPVPVDNVNAVDTWSAGLSEQPVPGALVGPLFRSAIVEQFARLRDADRFWYQNYLPPAARAWAESQTLGAILVRNSKVGAIPASVFLGH